MKGLLGLMLLLLSLFFVPTAFAQEELLFDPLSPTPTPEVTYTLPYPGLLPDNPLYALKATRDRVISFFIADPLKKAEFDLLQADKRLQAGVFLLDRENPPASLAISTISKGQNYFEEALVVVSKWKKEATAKTAARPSTTPSPMISDMPNKLYNAARKHYQTLRLYEKTIPKEKREEYTQLLIRSKKLLDEATLVHSAR